MASLNYTGGDMVNAGRRVSQANLNLLKKYAKENNLTPSFMLAQTFLESYWGTSYSGQQDKNWSGITWKLNAPSDLNIHMSMGTKREEGGNYVRFSTLDDFFKAYAFVLSSRNGIYKVVGATSIDEFCKGLFIVGGAKNDFAGAGYESYLHGLVQTYNVIVQQNGDKVKKLDQGEGEDADMDFNKLTAVRPINTYGVAYVTNQAGSKVYSQANFSSPSGKKLPFGSAWLVGNESDGFLLVGGNEYIPVYDVYMRRNPGRTRNDYRQVTIAVTTEDAWTQKVPKKKQAGERHLDKNSEWIVTNQSTDGDDLFFEIGTNIWISATKVGIRL
ncbi:MAG: glucosaminidase domain-containing protein [Schleiferilactobacillus harbinensis]|jgi:hypothetical protein|nr:glucosaminidase domain-containing protein [Schleiferilactobacillus harbinensis]MCI1912763.1 glucosaminidase domain-containing protein [Schleiferilactobacillus harbinensis]